MLKIFPIDFIRQAFEQKLLEEHNNNLEFFGSKNQVAIASFYEQLKSQDEVDRFVENWRDLTEQQNRSGLILNGVLVSPENPSITNLYSSLIIPMSWTCSLRCLLSNRDQAIWTINNLIDKLKGRKVDIAQLNCLDSDGKKYSVPFMVGTIGQYQQDTYLKNGDFIGIVNNAPNAQNVIDNLISKGVNVNYVDLDYLYCENANKIKVLKVTATKEDVVDGSYEDDYISDGRYVVGSYDLLGEWTIEELYPTASATVYLYGNSTITLTLDNGTIEIINVHEQNGQKYTKVQLMFDLGGNADDLCPGFDGTFDIEEVYVYHLDIDFDFIEDDGSYPDIVFPPEHESFEKYKLSFSFDAIRCDEPRNLNANEYCELSFGGSATLVSDGVKLGNDLLKISISKYQLITNAGTTTYANNITYLEPLEMPSGNNANTQINQLASNKFITNTHTDGLTISLQYTFIMDENIDLLNQLFDYARYGTQGLTINDISPNIIYKTTEYWSSWGNFVTKEMLTKLVENVDIENTESDALTISVSMQRQGENN